LPGVEPRREQEVALEQGAALLEDAEEVFAHPLILASSAARSFISPSSRE
jgi:hypothetical protein